MHRLVIEVDWQLYQQLESAPTSAVKNLEEQIADLHLAQFELSQQRDQLFQKTQYLDNLIANSSEPVSAEDKANLSTLLDTRISLLDQLNRQLDSQLTNAISLQLTQQQLTRIYASIEFTLQQHIFWVSSNKPIDGKWFINWPGHAYKQVSDLVLKPLPGLPVIRDLIVDMTQFFKQYHSIKPYLQNDSLRRSSSRSRSLSGMLDSSGEITPPCGVPAVGWLTTPASITPACNHCLTSLSTRRSLTR